MLTSTLVTANDRRPWTQVDKVIDEADIIVEG